MKHCIESFLVSYWKWLMLCRTGKGDTLNASYLHTISHLKKIVVGAEISRIFSRNKNMFTIGTQHALDPQTTIKGASIIMERQLHYFNMSKGLKVLLLFLVRWTPNPFKTMQRGLKTWRIYHGYALFGTYLSEGLCQILIGNFELFLSK